MFGNLKPIAYEAAQRALEHGGTLSKMRSGFYSGGHSYTHVLSTKRGTNYRVSTWVFEALTVPAGSVIQTIG